MPSHQTNKSIIVIIWIAVAVIDFGVALASIEQGQIDRLIFAFPIMAAMMATLYIWTMQTRHEERLAQSAHNDEQEKSKHQAGDKLALLMQIMDDEERKALKERLTRQVLEEAAFQDDGELHYDSETLESLLEADEDRALLR